MNPEGVGFCCAFAIPIHFYFEPTLANSTTTLPICFSTSSHLARSLHIRSTRCALRLDLRYPLSSTIFPSLATSNHSFGTAIIDQYLRRMTPCH